MFGHRVQGGVCPGLSSGGHKFSLILLSVWLGGCLPVSTRHVTMLSAEERAQAAQLPVHTAGLPTGSYDMVESVRGLSCRVNQADGTRVSEAQALEELGEGSVLTRSWSWTNPGRTAACGLLRCRGDQ